MHIFGSHTLVCFDTREIRFPDLVVQIILVRYYSNMYECLYFLYVNILLDITGTTCPEHRSPVCVTYI